MHRGKTTIKGHMATKQVKAQKKLCEYGKTYYTQPFQTLHFILVDTLK